MKDSDDSRLAYLRKDVIERTNIDSKTEEDVKRGRLDRAQLYLFLTQVARQMRAGAVLVSRMSKQHFWCQTGFVIKDNVVYGKYGDSPYQPIGWDTGNEFYPLDIAKLLWKHEFAWFSPNGNAVEAPWDVQIESVSVDEVDDPDGSALTDKERKTFERLIKDVKEELDWIPPKTWKREAGFTPKTAKPKFSLQEVMDQTAAWLTEREDEFAAEATKRAEVILALGAEDDATLTAHRAAYESTSWTGDAEKPTFEVWLVNHIAEGIATEAAAAFAKALRAETTDYTAEELDALARREEHDFRVRETIKLCSVASPRFDRKVQAIVSKHPGVGADLENLDIQGFAAQCVDWMRMRLDEDEAVRIVKGTTVTPRISQDELGGVEATTAGYLIGDLIEVRDGIAAAGGIVKLDDHDPLVYSAHAVIAQCQAALPSCRGVLTDDDITVDTAVEALIAFFDKQGWIPAAVPSDV
jgi:proteasome lid subunit RPN8/RPN11